MPLAKNQSKIFRPLRVAVFNDTAIGEHFGCTAVMSTIISEIEKRGHKVIISWPVDVDWRPSARWFESQNIDIVIVNGEGSIHHTETRRKARYLCEIGEFARDVLRVPAYLLNATMTDLTPASRNQLTAFNGIFVRETATKGYLRNLDISAKVVPDLSIFSPLLSLTGDKNLAPLVTDSVIPEVADVLQNIATAGCMDFVRMEKMSKNGFLARIHRRYKEAKFNPEVSLYSRRKHVDLAEFGRFYKRLSAARFVITGRFHSIMMCVSAGTPFLAVESNTPKISSVLCDIFKNSNRVVDADSIIRDISDQQKIGFTHDEAENLISYVDNGRHLMNEMFDQIFEI